MIRARVVATAAIVLLSLVACGKKGAPLAPLRPVPARVSDVAGRRVGPQMRIQFTLPTQNVSGTEGIDLGEVDIYAITVEPGGVVPPAKELLTRKYLVTSLPVKPPPVESEETPTGAEATAKEEARKAADAKDTRPLPGERVTFVEPLTEAQLKPATTPKPPPPKGAPATPAVLDPPVVSRYYYIRGRSRRGEPGAVSARLVLPLVPAPQPPSELKATITETAVALGWTAPPETFDPVAAAANEQAWAAANAPIPPPVAPRTPPAPIDPSAPKIDPADLVRLTRLPGVALPMPLLPSAPRFNVYAVKDGMVEQQPLNASPITAASAGLGEPVWNEERCFVVTTVRVYGVVAVESEAAGPHCLTAVDTFPPAAPAGLKAVAIAGAMNLIWEANTEADLAGYIVLRGEAPGETLQALTTTPIRETNYRDTTVKPGVRYVYAIVALDKATAPNTSAQSARVEETAR